MAAISRYITRYKHPYARPARYSSHTHFSIETDDGERYEFLCGGKYKTYNQFINKMKERHGTDIKIDRSKPYVIYQS